MGTKKNVFSVLASLAYLAGCLLFLYAYPSWKPVLYFVSIAVSAVSAGLITWLYANKKPLLKALLCGAGYFAGFFGTAYLVNNVILGARESVLATVIISLMYRLKQLEFKVGQHNHFDTRLVAVEQQIKTLFNQRAG